MKAGSKGTKYCRGGLSTSAMRFFVSLVLGNSESEIAELSVLCSFC